MRQIGAKGFIGIYCSWWDYWNLAATRLIVSRTGRRLSATLILTLKTFINFTALVLTTETRMHAAIRLVIKPHIHHKLKCLELEATNAFTILIQLTGVTVIKTTIDTGFEALIESTVSTQLVNQNLHAGPEQNRLCSLVTHTLLPQILDVHVVEIGDCRNKCIHVVTLSLLLSACQLFMVS